MSFEEPSGCAQDERCDLELTSRARYNDILLEGPNARYQDLMDRYVHGENVPVESLRRAWDDSTQQQAGGPMWTGEVPSPVAT